MEFFANPVFLYLCLALGGVGVATALPRRGVNPQVIGALLAAIALGGAFLALGVVAGENRPGLWFYVFSAIALGSALRVISHPKPVYAALYFIMTILSSSAIYLMLGAEFMAFALVIIYAGAILITYLFVIMLAEQAPSDEDLGSMSEYDRFSREPAVAAAVGFVLLALLTGMLTCGAQELKPAPVRLSDAAMLERMPKKVLAALDRQGVFEPRGGLARPALENLRDVLDAPGREIKLKIADAAKFEKSITEPRVRGLVISTEAQFLRQVSQSGAPNDFKTVTRASARGDWVILKLPDEVRAENVDGVGFALVGEHPMALELAGVILLMAMLGAVVLARKQIEIGEAEKAAAARGGGAW